MRWLFVSRPFEEASGKICHKNPVSENATSTFQFFSIVRKQHRVEAGRNDFKARKPYLGEKKVSTR